MNMAVDYASPEDAIGIREDQVRNATVEYTMMTQGKLLWFVDSDVLPPNYAVQRLFHEMINKPEVMVVAGIYFSKQDKPTPVVFEEGGKGPYFGWNEGEVFEVPGFIGAGCMLIRAELFNKIPPPYFVREEYPDKVTDDAFFCRKVKAAGYKVLGHGGVLCGHYDHRTRKVIQPEQVMKTWKRIAI